MLKKLAVLLLVAAPALAGCRTTAPSPSVGKSGAGASTPTAAVERFLAAARAQDITALSLIWGTANGPARATIPKDELERREIIMLCHLRHERHRIVDEVSLLQGQRRVTVDLTAGEMTRRTNLTTIPATGGGWYVLAVDLEPLRDICAARRQ